MDAANREVSMAHQAAAQDLDVDLLCGFEDPIAFRELLTKVGDKWSIFVLLALSMLPGKRARFSELNRAIPAISERMLALTLRQAERDGLRRGSCLPKCRPASNMN